MTTDSRPVRSDVARPAPVQRRTDSGRPIAAGGWRRALLGLTVGAVTGAAVLLARRGGGA